MNHFTLSDLKRSKQPRTLEIQALESGLYVAYCQMEDEQRKVIHRQKDKPLVTKSIEDMKTALRGIHFADRMLVMRSSYDEMIHTDTYREPVKARLHW
jgi:hypothetical protein